MKSESEKKGYSSLSPEMLCPKCEHGMVMEGPGGRTQVLCTASDGERKPVTFLVTCCSAFNRKEVQRMYDVDGMENISFVDGHVMKRVYAQGQGWVWIRAVKDNGTLTSTEEELRKLKKKGKSGFFSKEEDY